MPCYGAPDGQEIAGGLSCRVLLAHATLTSSSDAPSDPPGDSGTYLAAARAQRISITTSGADVLQRMMDHRAAAIREAIAHWPERDRADLRQLLRRLAEDLSVPSMAAGPMARTASEEPARAEEMAEKS